MSDEYLIPDLAPDHGHTAQMTVKKSQFICTIGHADSPEAARDFINAVRRLHAGATHNCSAFVAGPAGDTARIGASDDGEPSGTAGRPMLTALLHSGVGEIVAVVTRYYGGILLGTGGLVRAYQGAVKEALETLPTKKFEKGTRLLVSVDLALAGDVEHFLRQARGRVLTSDFRYDASFEVTLPEKEVGAFEGNLMRISSGEALVERLEDDDAE